MGSVGLFLIHNIGNLLRSIQTGSQVCDILWSRHYKELVSAQNDASNQLVIWKYPTLDKFTTLPGHSQRPMHLALSPDGQTIASLGDDESLKFWKCFATTPGQKPLINNRKRPVQDSTAVSTIR